MTIHTNKQRREWWEQMKKSYSAVQVMAASQTFKPEVQEVMTLHYDQHIPLTEIATRTKRSMTTIRNHQAVGIFKLCKYLHNETAR